MHLFRLGKTIQDGVYADTAAYFADLAAVYREEINALAADGCTYIQLDDVPIPMLCDPKVQARVREDGLDPDQLMADYVDLFKDCLRGRPAGVTVAVHMCRGNYKGKFLSEGGYETFAEMFFNKLDVDAFFLEYDDERSGDFEPLRFVPKDKVAVLGIVSSKTPEMESKDSLKSRIDEAAEVHRPRSALPQPSMRICQHGRRQPCYGGRGEGEAVADRRNRCRSLGLGGWDVRTRVRAHSV